MNIQNIHIAIPPKIITRLLNYNYEIHHFL